MNDVACSVPNPKLAHSDTLLIRCMVDGVSGEYDALAVSILDIVNTVEALTTMAFLDLIMIDFVALDSFARGRAWCSVRSVTTNEQTSYFIILQTTDSF